MKILGRLFWTIVALVASIYVVVIGGAYIICSPFIWVMWWVISGKSFAFSNILFAILTPAFMVFDHLEKISNI